MTTSAITTTGSRAAELSPDALNQEFLRALEEGARGHSLRFGMDYHQDKLWYGMDFKSKPYFLASGRQGYPADKLPDSLQSTGTADGMPISGDGMKRYLSGGTVDGAAILARLEEHFRLHAKFQHRATPAVLALWSLAGWLHMAFHEFPYLWITSPQRGCGKSRVLELLASVGFRAEGISINPTSAVLFRSLNSSARVLIVDEFERSTDENKGALINILNSGFTRGSRVQRCTGKDYGLESFDAYGPKAFAGLSNLPDTLSSRTIPIEMLPKTPADGIQPFSATLKAAELQQLRDDLGIWALTNAPLVAKLAADRVGLGIPAALDDRATDYMVALFAVSGATENCFRENLLEFCDHLAGMRSNEVADGPPARAVMALQIWLGDRPEAKISLKEAGEILAGAGLPQFRSAKTAGRLFRNFGLAVGQIRFDADKTGKGAVLTNGYLSDLAQRFPVRDADGVPVGASVQ